MIGSIYLLHFDRPLGNPANRRALASHYLGWALDPAARERQHRAGQGAALTRAAVAQGVTWDFFVLGEGDRALERRIKSLKATPRLCPICGRRHPAGRLHVPQLVYAQLALPTFDPDPFDVPAPPWSMTGPPDAYEWAYIAAARRARVEAVAAPVVYDDSDCDIPF